MASATVVEQPTNAGPAFKPIIDDSAAIKLAAERIDFEPQKHIAFEEPEQIVSMRDIGHPETRGISPIAVSQPFRLFSKEAVRKMRSEIFKADVMDNCKFTSDIAACQLRGYSPKYAPFIYDAWNSPEILSIVSKIAQVALIPAMDFEIGHVNFSVKSEEQTQKEIDTIKDQKRFFNDDEGIAGCPWEDDKPVVGWHTDSYPFVCVLMLSDCTNMVGGETALQTGTGDIMKVRGPDMGCAVVMQGRYITHQALRALGAQERITMVTSFRPRSPFVKDDSVLKTVRPVSDLSELYFGFGEYRMEIMEERLRAKIKEIRDKRRAGKKFATAEFKDFLSEQVDFLAHTNEEIVLTDEVIRGRFNSTAGSDENPQKRAKVA